MKKNKLFMIIFVFVMFFCINIDGVLALNERGGGGSVTSYSYGVRCFYSGKLKSYDSYNPTASGSIGENTTSTPFIYGVELRCNSKNCNSVSAYGHGRGAHINGDRLLKVEFNNYNQLFKIDNTSVRDKAYGVTPGKGIKKCPSKLYIDSALTTSASELMAETDYIGNAWWVSGSPYNGSLKLASSYKFYEDDKGNLEQDVIDMVSELKEITKDSSGNSYDTTHGSVGDKIKGDQNQMLVESIKRWAESKKDLQKEANLDIDESDELDCSQVLGDSFAEVLSGALTLICISAVVILIFTMISDFIKAITSNENDALIEAFKKSKTRIIATIILLLLPVLVNLIINFLNKNFRIEDGNIKIGDISECNISKVK